MGSLHYGIASAGIISVGYFAAPTSGRTAGFFMFVTLVSIVSWIIVATTTVARHGAKHVYKRPHLKTAKAHASPKKASKTKKG